MESVKQFGRLLNVDMNSGECTFSRFPEAALKYIGGRGFNAWYLYRNLSSGTDPLAPDNILMLSCGLLTGSSAPTSARLHLNGLSPLTGILGSSNIGGY
ncbi:MAG: aldehyde ferredoxin oxidoreductase N-terminal domain-containing protein, partial [Desulfobulbia bacterium]